VLSLPRRRRKGRSSRLCRELYLVLRWIVSELEWLLGEGAVGRLVGSDAGSCALASDGGQDGEVFRHMLCDEGVGGGRR
jgi:hypothetical protein